jgi:hypothetical protein
VRFHAGVAAPRMEPARVIPSLNEVPMAKAKGVFFRRYFRHWRSGKLMDAWAYGYRAWPIGR